MSKTPGPFEPDRRKNPPASRRLTIILFLLACGYITAVLYIAQGTSHRVDRGQYHNDLSACQQRRQLQIENNRRVPEHETDAHDLTKLSRALTHTRVVEARAFSEIGRVFHIERVTAPLVAAYELAARRDEAVVLRQRTVRFHKVTLANCAKEVPKP